MSTYVLDCSIAVAWLIEDEANPETDELLSRLRISGALVPGLWYIEVGNVLIQSEKRGRITAAQILSRIELLKKLPITLDKEPVSKVFREIQHVAREHELTMYDATYLELAMRCSLPLATKLGK